MASFARPSVSQGVPSPPPAPAVHWIVERLQTPVVGFGISVSAPWLAGAPAVVSVPGDCGLAGPERCRALKVTYGAYQCVAVRHLPDPFS